MVHWRVLVMCMSQCHKFTCAATSMTVYYLMLLVIFRFIQYSIQYMLTCFTWQVKALFSHISF